MGKLSEEEKEIRDAFERGKLKSIPRVKQEIQQNKAYANATFRKDKRINVRISTRDLTALQKRALSEGIPYQTLVSSLLHKYVDGRLVEK